MTERFHERLMQGHMNSRQKWKSHQQAKDKCLTFDLYGKPVSLTFQGSDKYRTRIGAVITVIVSIMLISFGVFRFLSMANENVQQISMHVSNLKQN